MEITKCIWFETGPEIKRDLECFIFDILLMFLTGHAVWFIFDVKLNVFSVPCFFWRSLTKSFASYMKKLFFGV